MQKNRLYFRLIAYFFSLLILFQSCAVYQGSYTMMDAWKSERGVKLLTNKNEQLEYRKIDTLNGQWVGLIHTNSNISEFESINTESIVKIQLKRSKKSEQKEGLVVVGIIVGVVVGTALFISAVKNASWFGDN